MPLQDLPRRQARRVAGVASDAPGATTGGRSVIATILRTRGSWTKYENPRVMRKRTMAAVTQRSSTRL